MRAADRARLVIRRRGRSVRDAVRGIARTVRQEPNARLHGLATGIVVIAGIAAHLSLEEWRWLILACALVWSAEAVNTAIEHVCDRVSPDHDPLIGAAKDVAAGAVLIAALGAALIGLSIFLDPALGGRR